MTEDPDHQTQLLDPLTPAGLLRMNLPRGLWNVTYEGAPASIRPTMERYLANLNPICAQGASLVLTGGSGVGKSGAAAVIAKELWIRRKLVYFVSVSELKENAIAKSRWQGKPEPIIDRAQQSAILILDDLTKASSQDNFFKWDDLINILIRRAANSLPTIITSRMTRPEVDELPRWDTLVDCYAWRTVTGPDLRKPRNKQTDALFR